LQHGNVEDALRSAPHTLSEQLVIGRGSGQPMETRGIAAEYNAMSGLLTVWAASQVPHQIRQIVCSFLGLAPHRVRVIAPDVGGGFGAKLIVYPEDVLIPLLAFRLERSVRWIESRVEHMLAATQERTQTHEVTAGFDDGGRLLAVRDNFVHDNGAYTPRGLVVPLLTASMLSGPYRIPNLEITFESIYTHRVPVTPYRGAGQPQAVFVIERILDAIARKTGCDRAEVRAINLVRPEDMPYNVGITNYRNAGPVIYDSGDYPAVLRKALKLANYQELVRSCAQARQAGRLRGVGLACHVELTGVGPFEGASARVDPTGKITVFTGATSQGQGLETTLAQVAASEFGVTPDDISIVAGDTLGIDHGIGSFASRAAVAGGSAVALAARDLRTKARQLAAQVFGVTEAEVEQDGTTFMLSGRNKPQVELGQLASASAMATAADGLEPGLQATRYFQPTDLTYSSGAHVALVEIDADTGAVEVQGYWLCHDCGQPINPTVVEGQIHGAVALGIGSALLEEICFDAAGQPLSGSFMDYTMPRAADLPEFVTEHMETLSPLNPLGLKGVGESGTLPVPAVIASAIEDALSNKGTRIRHMPLTLLSVAALLREP
jgi:carbon-monoxide dehydrogenase large subunit